MNLWLLRPGSRCFRHAALLNGYYGFEFLINISGCCSGPERGDGAPRRHQDPQQTQDQDARRLRESEARNQSFETLQPSSHHQAL